MVALALRFWTAVILLFAIIFIQKRKVPLDRLALIMYAVVGVFSMALSYFCTYWGMRYIPSSLSAILWATFPLTTGIFAHLLVRTERMNLLKLGAILIATSGVVAILSDQRLVLSREVLLGSIVVLLGVALAAYPNVLLKARYTNYDPVVMTAMSILAGAFLHTIGALVAGDLSRTVWNLPNLGSAVYLGIFGSAAAFFLYYSLLKKIAIVKLSFITFLTPIMASFVGWMFLKETLTLRELAGMLLIFAGLTLFDGPRYYQFIRYRRLQRRIH